MRTKKEIIVVDGFYHDPHTIRKDALTMEFREVRIVKNPGCPLCGDEPTVTQLIDYEAFCGIPSKTQSLPVS